MLFPHPIRSLAQIPDLAPLLEICRELDVEITAFGSLVRRLARSLISPQHRQEELPDLFQLAPFLSDIDLRHSGPPERTDDIRKAILARIPFSECFRWQIFSDEELREFTDDEAHRPVIPVNKLRLGTRAGNGIEDPFEGSRDLRTGKFRLLRSAFYERSTLRRGYRDAELLYAMEYLKVLFEESAVVPAAVMEQQPGWQVAREIADDALTPALLGALEESAYLRAKFRYRSQALRAACRDEAAWQVAIGAKGLGPAFQYVDEGLPFAVLDFALEEGGGSLEDPIASSCRLVGDRFRLRVPPISEPHYEMAGEAWEAFRQERHDFDILSKHPFPELPAGQRIVADTPEYEFNLGPAPSATGDEHLHFQLTLPEECASLCQGYGESGLAAFLLLTAKEEPFGRPEQLRSFAFPIATVCWLAQAQGSDGALTRLQIRANCGRLLEAVPDLLWQVHDTRISGYRLKLFVVGRS